MFFGFVLFQGPVGPPGPQGPAGPRGETVSNHFRFEPYSLEIVKDYGQTHLSDFLGDLLLHLKCLSAFMYIQYALYMYVCMLMFTSSRFNCLLDDLRT